MTDHRRSYWKSTVVTGLIVVVNWAALLWLIAKQVQRYGTQSWPELLFWTGIGCALLLSATVVTLVFGGALIVMRRDRLEILGLPYAGPPREWHGGPLTNLVRRAIRRLRGRQFGQLGLCAGEEVEILSREEILATLDPRGELDCLPFMPEMESWCGQKARVFRRVDKIFDWITMSGLRRMRDTVILEKMRCDGRHHGECQADCPVLWKEAWLRRTSDGRPRTVQSATSQGLKDLRPFTTRIDSESGETRFVCQLCRMPQATTPTPWNSPRNLLRELLSGNVSLRPFLAFISIFAFNAVQKRIGGASFPILGHSDAAKTPHVVLNIQPGELVRIKTKRDIEQTLDSQFKNRGLWFDKEMTRFCGGTYKVRARVDRQIDERTGKMVTIKTPCITLEDVTATGEYFEFAPLDERIYWREIWLERAETGLGTAGKFSGSTEEPVPHAVVASQG